MKYDIIAIGGSTEDITFYTDEGVIIDNKKDILRQKLLAFEYGAKIRISKSESFFGGGAANAAVNFAGLGLRTGGMITVGQDERGDMISRNLKKRGVDVSLLQLVKGASGFSFTIIAQTHEHVIFSNREANDRLKIGPVESKQLENTNWIYLSSLSGKWQSVCDKIFNLKDVAIAWNPGNTQLSAGVAKIRKYLKNTSILSMNKDEATELVMSDPKHGHDTRKQLENIENLIKALKSYGPGIVVVTDGTNGAYVYDGTELIHQPIKKAKKVVDTTGVGDCFASSFVAGYHIFKGDIAKALRLSMVNSSSLVQKAGAQNGLLTRSDISKLIK